jgi:hypothetical protein
MRPISFTFLAIVLLMCGCVSPPRHVAGDTLANRSPEFLRLTLQAIIAEEQINGPEGETIKVMDTQVLEKPKGFTVDHATNTAFTKWVERWTIQRPNGVVTYRVTYDVRGPEGVDVGVILEDANGQPKIPTINLQLNK